MKLDADKAIAVGWDVRGWRSRQQSVAIATIDGDRVRWLGLASEFEFRTARPVDLNSLTEPALDSDQRHLLAEAARVVVAIDSPLAFPTELRRLMDGKGRPVPTASEIENPLAYRDCDRRVAEVYGKKPLSAAFDRLGNTASLAMTLCLDLRERGFSVVPQDADSADRAVIEVYPGIHKQGPRRSDLAVPGIARWIPQGPPPGSDLYDACICAILGLVFAGAGEILGLPMLTRPDPALPREEGWLFGLPPEAVA